MDEKLPAIGSPGGRDASGVDELISRLRQDGVAAGEARGRELVAEADRQAKQIVAAAREEAKQIVAAAAAEVARMRESGEHALKLAARDTMLRLESRLMAAFAELTRGLVKTQMADPDFLRQLVLEVAGHARDDANLDRAQRLEVQLPAALGATADEAAEARLTEFSREIMAAAWRKGVTFAELSPGEVGIKVRLQDEGLEVDLGEQAIADMLLVHLQPRFRALLHGISREG